MEKTLNIPGCTTKLQVFENDLGKNGMKDYEYSWKINLSKSGYDFRYASAYDTITSDRYPEFLNGFRAAIAKYNEMLECDDIPCKSGDYTHSRPAIRVVKLLPQMIKEYNSQKMIEYQPKCISLRLNSHTGNTFSAEFNISEAEQVVNELEKVPSMVDIMIKKMTLLRTEFPEDI